jgi:hypothetical protein
MRGSSYLITIAKMACPLFLAIACCLCPITNVSADNRSPGGQIDAIVLNGPVRVTSRAVSPDYPDFELEVQYRDAAFSYRTFILGVSGLDGAAAFQKKHTGWEGPYLFVRTECGGGNAWRCNQDAIFRLKSGRLVRLGKIYADGRDASYNPYRKGRFRDLYDKFEENDLTDHATAPSFWIALDEKGG